MGSDAGKVLRLACFLPPFLGLWKSEYAVSYGYGLAMFLSGGLVLASTSSAQLNPFAAAHAAVLCLYGARLSCFLLYREANIKYFKEMRERIETKSSPTKRGRLPFVLACGGLYLCMASPVVLSSRYAGQLVPGSMAHDVASWCVRGMWASLTLNALGDVQKTWAKGAARRRGDTQFLVTGGLFSLLRHPNYTGEQFLWVSSALLGVTAALTHGPKACLPWVAASVLGAGGIAKVLWDSTTFLEEKQETTYGDTDEFRRWLKRSWGGFHGYSDEARRAAMTEADLQQSKETGEEEEE